MSINAAMQFVRDQLQGLSSPYLAPLTSWIMPPASGDIATPQAYVWASRIDGKRLTVTRGQYDGNLDLIQGSGGNRRHVYNIAIYVDVAFEPDADHADEAFPLLLQQILKKLWSIAIVIPITDPTTLEISALQDIGENYSIEYIPPHTLADQRYVRMSALITLTVTENFAG